MENNKFRLAVFLICGSLLAHFGVRALNCGDETSARTIAIKNPPEAPNKCVYRIKPNNGYVEQLKIEFSIRLAQPIFEETNCGEGTLHVPLCSKDSLEMGGLKFCGIEEKQHVYLPFIYHEKASFDVTIHLAERSTNTSLVEPYWSLVISQVGGLYEKRREDDDTRFPPLAPPDCLQYFTEWDGLIQSFNYKGFQGNYPADLKYTICVKRPVGDYHMHLEFLEFDLRGDVLKSEGVQSFYPYCASPENQDRLMITHSAVLPANSSDLRDNVFCGASIKHREIITRQSGVFRISFEPRSFAIQNKPGFWMAYKMTPTFMYMEGENPQIQSDLSRFRN